MSENKIDDKTTLIELLSDSYDSGAVDALESMKSSLEALKEELPNNLYTVDDFLILCDEMILLINEQPLEDESEEEKAFFETFHDVDEDEVDSNSSTKKIIH